MMGKGLAHRHRILMSIGRYRQKLMKDDWCFRRLIRMSRAEDVTDGWARLGIIEIMPLVRKVRTS